MFISFIRSVPALLLVVGAQAAPTPFNRPFAAPSPAMSIPAQNSTSISTSARITPAASLTFPASGCVTTSGDLHTVSEYPHDNLGALQLPLPTTTIPFCLCAGKTVTSLALYLDPSGTGATTACAEAARATGTWEKLSYGPDVDQGTYPELLVPPKDSKCSDAGNVNPDCWKELDIFDYAQWWWHTHKLSCGDKSFAECFLYQTAGLSSSDCDNIQPVNCNLPQWSTVYKNQHNGARNYYIAYNIFSMNSFFTHYYQAVSNALPVASGHIGDMVQLINPQHDAKESGLKFALDILAIPMGVAGMVPIEGEWLKIMMEGLKQAVDVSKELIKDDPDASNVGDQLLEWADVSNSLAQMVSILESRLAAALKRAITDVNTFTSLGSSGAFSFDMDHQPDVETMRKSILQGLITFAASQLYQLTNHVLTRAPNTNVVDLQHGGKLNWDTGCDRGLGSWGECDSFYVHTPSTTTYGLVKVDDATVNFNPQMQGLFAANESGTYTTGELLFHGAALCADAGASPRVDLTKPDFGASCLSSIKVCTWNMDPAGFSSGQGKFMTDCDNIATFNMGLVVQSLGDVFDDNQGFWFPNAYLGTLVHSDRDHGAIAFFMKRVEAPPPFAAIAGACC